MEEIVEQRNNSKSSFDSKSELNQSGRKESTNKLIEKIKQNEAERKMKRTPESSHIKVR